MKIILNLEKVVECQDIESAKQINKDFWDHSENCWLTDDMGRYPSIVINEGQPIGYLSSYGSSRVWDWDDTKALKECSTFSNPFTNGSICCNVWNKRKNNLI
jgi:hypothetical protein